MTHRAPYINPSLIAKKLMILRRKYFRKSRTMKRSTCLTSTLKDGHILLRVTLLLITIVKRRAIRSLRTLWITLTIRIRCVMLSPKVQKVYTIRKRRIVPLMFPYGSIRPFLLRTLLVLNIVKPQRSQGRFQVWQRVVPILFVKNHNKIRRTPPKYLVHKISDPYKPRRAQTPAALKERKVGWDNFVLVPYGSVFRTLHINLPKLPCPVITPPIKTRTVTLGHTLSPYSLEVSKVN